jgi:hypothetical protein
MKIIIAPDSFKESLTASQVSDGLDRGRFFKKKFWTILGEFWTISGEFWTFFRGFWTILGVFWTIFRRFWTFRHFFPKRKASLTNRTGPLIIYF